MFDSRSKDKTKRLKMEPDINKEGVNSTKSAVPEIVNATASKRVIRKVVLLDPTKIKKLGLESRIIQAVNKFKDTPTVANKPAENIPSIGSIGSNHIEKDNEKCKVPVTPANTKTTPASFCDKARLELSQVKSRSDHNQVQQKLRSISESTSKLIKDFKGFTNVEIAEGSGDLKRLSNFIESFKQTQPTQIPSFKHLQTYLCNKKYTDKKRTNKGERRWSCPVSLEQKETESQSIKIEQADTTPNPPSLTSTETLHVEINAHETNPEPEIEQIISPIPVDESFCVKEEEVDFTYNINFQNYTTNQDPIISVGPPLQNRTKSNKGIVILDQKIIKTGFYPEVKSEVIQDVINSPEQKIEPPCLTTNHNLPTQKSDRTILVKILGQDSDSNDIHIEVLDPLIKMQVPKEPTDPIKNICKSYVKKMLKSSGIKRIKINPIEKSPKKGQTVKKSPARCEGFAANNVVTNENFNLLGYPRHYSNDQRLKIAPQFNHSQVPSSEMPLISYPSTNQGATNYQQNLSYNLPSNISNTNKPMHHNESNMYPQSTASNQNSNIACAINDEPMDAVEYILNCTQGNDAVNNISNFEDEDDLEEVDWGDEDDDYEEFQDLSNQNCSSYNAMDNELAPDSKSSIINMIEQAEITFEPDINGSFQPDTSGNVNQPILEAGQVVITSSGQIIPEHNAIMPASNDSLEIFTIKEIDPAKDACNQVAANETVAQEPINLDPPKSNDSFKKRKLTIKKYENVNTTALSKIQERIKQRMIAKTQPPSTQFKSSEPMSTQFTSSEPMSTQFTSCEPTSTQFKSAETTKDIKPQILFEHVDQSNLEIISCQEVTTTEEPCLDLTIEEDYSENNQICDDPRPAARSREDVLTTEEPSSDPIVNQPENSTTAPPQPEEIKSQSVETKPKGKGRRFKVTPVMRNRPRPTKQIKSENVETNINDSVVVKSEKSQCNDVDLFTVHNIVESTESVIPNNIENFGNQENSINTENSINIENSVHNESCSNIENPCNEINSYNVKAAEQECIPPNKSMDIIQKTIKKEKASSELKTRKTIKQEKITSHFDIIKNSSVNLPVEHKPSLHENETAMIAEAENNSGLDETNDHDEYFHVIEYNDESYAEEEVVTNSEEHDVAIKERKSNRARKPTSKADFVPIMNKKRKEQTEKEHAASILSRTEELPHRSANELGLKVYKSRRKNTIPEIDKLALKRRSMRVDNQNSNDKTKINQIDLNISEAAEIAANVTKVVESVDLPSPLPELIKPPNTNESQGIEFSVTPVRKRGRPRKNPIIIPQVSDSIQNTSLPTAEESNNSTSSKLAEESNNSTSSRLAEESNNSTSSETITNPDKPICKKRRAAACDYEMNPRLLLVNSVEEMTANIVDTESVNIDPKETSKCFRCGACKQFVRKDAFHHHIKEHYGVAWRDGLEKPINLSSYREVLNAMQGYMFKSKTPLLSCKACGEPKRSAAGVIAHLQVCLLNEEQLNELMLRCEFCKKAYLPPAFWTHTKACKMNPETWKNDQSVDMEPRRKSAIKANSSFKAVVQPSLKPDDFIKPYSSPRGGGLILRWRKEISVHGRAKCFESNCTFSTEDIEELKTHIKNCMNIRHGGFCCVRCEYYDIDKEKVRNHVLENHSKHLNNNSAEVEDNSNDSTVSESDLVGDDAEKQEGMSFRRESNLKKIRRNPSFCKNDDTYEGTLRIYEKMYTNEVLYPNLKPSEVTTVSPKYYDCFKPSLEKSIKFGFVPGKQINESIGASKHPSTWIELEQFGKKQIEDEMILFIGGPISHMAWIPHPSSKEFSAFEYLAVSYKKSYNVHRKFVGQPEENEVILIYQITIPTDKKHKITAELFYGVQLSGPIHHFAFLPSGGYAPEINRLGVLAVGTAKTCIHVYSLPLKASDENCDKKLNQPLCNILDIKPSLILCVDLSQNPYHIEGCMAQCTRIVWSEMKDHHIIAGGFSNGFVGIWDIRENNLTSIFNSEFQYCIPLSYFNAIPYAVSGLALHYASEGPRWLFVTNRTREFQTYDLDDLTCPTQVGPVSFQKSTMSGVVWPVYSENPMGALDDDYIDDVSFVFCRSVLNVNYKLKNVMHAPAGFECVEFSPFYNALLGGCENGDIVVQRFRKFSNESCFTNSHPRWFVFFTDICRLDGDPIPIVNPKDIEGKIVDDAVAETLDSFKPEYNNTHALVFGGPVACDRLNKSRVVSTSRVVPVSLRPLTRINCIAESPNFLSADVAAIGYNNGIIRLKIINFDDFV